MTRSLLRDVPVPVGSPADPLPTDPSDLVARRALRRSLGGGRPRAVSLEPLASPHRNRLLSPASQWSSRGGRHTPAWRGSASPESADRSWKRGRTGRLGTFSAASVPGQKRGRILPFEKPVFWAFQDVT